MKENGKYILELLYDGNTNNNYTVLPQRPLAGEIVCGPTGLEKYIAGIQQPVLIIFPTQQRLNQFGDEERRALEKIVEAHNKQIGKNTANHSKECCYAER